MVGAQWVRRLSPSPRTHIHFLEVEEGESQVLQVAHQAPHSHAVPGPDSAVAMGTGLSTYSELGCWFPRLPSQAQELEREAGLQRFL